MPKREKYDTDENQILDLTGEAEVADEDAERLAVFGPPDGANEKTPTRVSDKSRAECPECHGPIELFEDFIPQPKDMDAAWGLSKCYGTKSDFWRWCPKSGILFGRFRVSWERRGTPRASDSIALPEVIAKRRPEVGTWEGRPDGPIVFPHRRR